LGALKRAVLIHKILVKLLWLHISWHSFFSFRNSMFT
jgi:hypothetical protein